MLNYESKFMQTLMLIGDYMILNILFVVCSIPIFTIGAAQAGLYTGVKSLLDKDDDTPCTRSFFKGFSSGFGNITVVSTILLVIIALLGYSFFVVQYFDNLGFKPQPWMIILALAFCAIFHSNITLFHANFGCTKMQLIKNVFFTCIAHPIRSIGVGFFTWIPVLTFLFLFPLFMQATPIWIIAYYTIAFVINTNIMKKPYHTLTENFVASYEEKHGEITIESEEK